MDEHLKDQFLCRAKKTLLIWSISNFYEPIEKCHQIDSGNITIKATLTVNNNFVFGICSREQTVSQFLLDPSSRGQTQTARGFYRLERLEQCLKMKATVERYACNSLEKWNTL